MYSEILNLVRTVDERNLLSVEMNLLAKSLYQTSEKENFESVLKSSVRASSAEAIRKLLGTTVPTDDVFKEIDRQLESMPIIHLEVAVEPSEATIEAVYNWVRKNTNTGAIVEFKLMPALGGGAVVSFRGKYTDASLRAKMIL